MSAVYGEHDTVLVITVLIVVYM